ncbi:MAG TPA: leucyl aminopeptidase [Candidatus Acidoferrales bacterium]|nr:leucyl aminopeptidase [Candidatus Acidoferrales bacterium]
MEISIEIRPVTTIDTEALVTYAFEEDDPIHGQLAELDQAAGGALRKLVASGELTGKALEMTLLHYVSGLGAQRLLVVGAGKREKFSGVELRRLAGAGLRYLKARKVTRLAFLPRENDRSAAAAQAITEGLLLADFESDKYKTEKKNGREIEAILLVGWTVANRAEGDQGLARGRTIAESQNFTRELVNEPANRLTPRMLAERAEAMAREVGLGVQILDERRIAELKMGALLGVAQGSAEPPRVIVLTYAPAETRPGAPVIGLVGKAITFDSGGISIKPAEGMEKMKYDMAGGAAMLGVMRALAQLKPAVKVIAIVPATENMPGGRAQKPGDIQIALSGKSIEVVNTDAEGRLILADGLAYARKLGCTHLVDAATLTGAIVVALANVNAGVFGSDSAFTDRLLRSARAAGEKMWLMPLDDEYREMIKSTIADMQNVGSGKGGGAVTAAMFLKEFVEETPWIHLDIAGTAWLDEAKPWAAKGASGVAVRTLVDLVMNLNSASQATK